MRDRYHQWVQNHHNVFHRSGEDEYGNPLYEDNEFVVVSHFETKKAGGKTKIEKEYRLVNVDNPTNCSTKLCIIYIYSA